eukprot:3479528-Amphidinium_carterae.1
MPKESLLNVPITFSEPAQLETNQTTTTLMMGLNVFASKGQDDFIHSHLNNLTKLLRATNPK